MSNCERQKLTGQNFTVIPGTFAVCRLPADEAAPGWVEGAPFWSITRTLDELCVICPEVLVPADVKRESGWSLLKLEGPLPLNAVGILASFAEPLEHAGISIVAISTFDTDYIFVSQEDEERAIRVLVNAGHVLLS
jgi:hypothetical protein